MPKAVQIFLAAALAAVSGQLQAAAVYPDKPIAVIVPFPAGGRSDLTIRLVGQYLEKELKQPLVVLNRPGAGGAIGFKGLANAQPNGYTIGFTTNAVVSTQYTIPDNLDLRDFLPICLFNSDPAVLAVASSAPWRDVPTLVKYAKDNPKQLLVGINPGASAHIFAAAFAKAARIDVTLVPYKGGPDRVAALAGGHINADFGVLAQYRAMMDTNRVRILGVAAAKRLPEHKSIPTFSEGGVNLQISGWQGFFAPRGTPPSIIKMLDDAIAKVIANKELIAQLGKIDVEVTYLPQREFNTFLKKEDADTRQLLNELGLAVTAPK